MTRLHRILLITLIESFATVTVERGIYFYTDERLGFSPESNLWMAALFGVCYVVGALASHRAAGYLGEKRLLGITLVAQLVVHGTLVVHVNGPMLFIAMAWIGLLNGLKWPVIESYVGAGRVGREQARAVGWFNISWASTVPLSMVAAGGLITYWPSGMFILPALINVVALVLIFPLPRGPAHLAVDHPTRPDSVELVRQGGLLISARWSMLASYSLLFVAAPLLPDVYTRLGVAVVLATAATGLIDLCRLAVFIVMRQWTAWHGRIWPVAVVVGLLPLGFAIMLYSPELAAWLGWETASGEVNGLGVAFALIGGVIFGLACGVTYYAALYYGLAVKNASVDAGGAHEGLIGAGFAIGPAAGLLGAACLPAAPVAIASLVGIGPLLVICMAGAGWAVTRIKPKPESKSEAGPGPN